MTRVVEDGGEVKGELFPPSPIPGPSSNTRKMAKARGPAEECEEEEEREIKLGKWDYVGGGRAVERGEEKRRNGMDRGSSKRLGNDHQQYREDRIRNENRRKRSYRQTGRRNSARGAGWERESRGSYPRENRVEAVVIHKTENVESYADILKKVKRNIN